MKRNLKSNHQFKVSMQKICIYNLNLKKIFSSQAEFNIANILPQIETRDSLDGIPASILIVS